MVPLKQLCHFNSFKVEKNHPTCKNCKNQRMYLMCKIILELRIHQNKPLQAHFSGLGEIKPLDSRIYTHTWYRFCLCLKSDDLMFCVESVKESTGTKGLETRDKVCVFLFYWGSKSLEMAGSLKWIFHEEWMIDWLSDWLIGFICTQRGHFITWSRPETNLILQLVSIQESGLSRYFLGLTLAQVSN